MVAASLPLLICDLCNRVLCLQAQQEAVQQRVAQIQQKLQVQALIAKLTETWAKLVAAIRLTLVYCWCWASCTARAPREVIAGTFDSRSAP